MTCILQTFHTIGAVLELVYFTDVPRDMSCLGVGVFYRRSTIGAVVELVYFTDVPHDRICLGVSAFYRRSTQ